ncbi:MAG: 4Fe-4S dicluster domain-containing protein [Clostridia bacterium]|nr:4Fe-4S dicluster domain-containing protein [Clostridia bacterium]
MSLDELRKIMQDHSIVGAGGAGFPSYAKLAEGAELLVINCAECEPLIYTDFMLMREKMDKIVGGAQIVMEKTGMKHTYISIKEHRGHMLGYTDGQVLGEHVTVKLLPNVYPMGDEINLIYETTGRLVQPGKLPISEGIIVFNGETVYNVWRAYNMHRPVVSDWFTIGGDLPQRYVVKTPIGTRLKDVFDQLGIIFNEETHTLINGGPSMGKVDSLATAIVEKTSKSFLIIPNTARAAMNKKVAIDDMLRRAASACCGCSRCTEMCPRHTLGYPIEPHKMIRVANGSAAADHPELITTATLCCSCGICAEVCCQEISPKDVILNLKGILAKNKMRFTPGNEVYKVSEDRPYRMISSHKWEDMLGVHKFDVVPEFVFEKLKVKRVEIPMASHIGAKAIPVVKVGDMVEEAQLIANAAEGLSVPQYASMAGKVTYVDQNKVVIEAI